MLTKTSKNQTRAHVHDRIRKKVLGTAERPRLNVYRSLNHIYVQVIDDLKGQTLVAASSAEGKKGELRSGGDAGGGQAGGKNIWGKGQGEGKNHGGFFWGGGYLYNGHKDGGV